MITSVDNFQRHWVRADVLRSRLSSWQIDLKRHVRERFLFAVRQTTAANKLVANR